MKKSEDKNNKKIIEENNNTESVAKETKADLGYKGKVTISIVNGKNIISKKTFSNTGGQPLFKFLINCLLGRFTAAAEEQPKYIVLGQTDRAESSPQKKSLTNKILYNTTTYGTNSNNKPVAILHFIVPKVWINTAEGNILNALQLVSAGNDINTMSAEIILNEDDEINLSQISENTNLIIEQELSIDNK